ncbi:programmed cell death 1 ligand 1-like [Centroberyx affinis]|uniref:programmed cell death 1 ligand 1-like n=1 Tax=Centroberyx affinis TaxID=166261 RepID=UPI003A5BA4FE
MESCGRLLIICLCCQAIAAAAQFPFTVSVTQSVYQAEEQCNVTLIWLYPATADMPLHTLFIDVLYVKPEPWRKIFRVENGVEDKLFPDEQYRGRMWCDAELARKGRIECQFSELRLNDTGTYHCVVAVGRDEHFKTCDLNVTAAEHLPEDPKQRELLRFGVIGVVAAVAAALAVLVAVVVSVAFAHQRCCPSEQQGQGQEENVDIGLLTDQTKNKELVSSAQAAPCGNGHCRNYPV